jgi:hypothetical protein
LSSHSDVGPLGLALDLHKAEAASCATERKTQERKRQQLNRVEKAKGPYQFLLCLNLLNLAAKVSVKREKRGFWRRISFPQSISWMSLSPHYFFLAIQKKKGLKKTLHRLQFYPTVYLTSLHMHRFAALCCAARLNGAEASCSRSEA